jgi:hypothetical protein
VAEDHIGGDDDDKDDDRRNETACTQVVTRACHAWTYYLVEEAVAEEDHGHGRNALMKMQQGDEKDNGQDNEVEAAVVHAHPDCTGRTVLVLPTSSNIRCRIHVYPADVDDDLQHGMHSVRKEEYRDGGDSDMEGVRCIHGSDCLGGSKVVDTTVLDGGEGLKEELQVEFGD